MPTPTRSPFSTSLVEAARDAALTQPVLPAWRGRFRAMPAHIEKMMLEVCRPLDRFADAIGAAKALYADFAAVPAWLGITVEPFVADPLALLAAELRADGQRLNHLLSQDAALAQASATPGFLIGIEPDSPLDDVWMILHSRYAPRALDEMELAQPRFGEDMVGLLALLRRAGAEPPPLARPALPWRVARAYSHYRYAAAYMFAHVRNEVLRLGAQAAAQGRLPAAEAVWAVSCDAALRLDDDQRLNVHDDEP